MDAANDPVHMFLMEAHSICVQAQFIVDSLPNRQALLGWVILGQTGTFFLGSINFNAFEGHRGALVGIVNANSEGCGETVQQGTVLVPGSCQENNRETGGHSKELECPLASLTLKTKHGNGSKERELSNVLCCFEMSRGRVRSRVGVGYWGCQFLSNADTPEQVIGYLKAQITTPETFTGSFPRTLSRKFLRNGYLLKATKEYNQLLHWKRRGELSRRQKHVEQVRGAADEFLLCNCQGNMVCSHLGTNGRLFSEEQPMETRLKRRINGQLTHWDCVLGFIHLPGCNLGSIVVPPCTGFRKYWFGKALETHLSAGSGKYLQGKLWKRIWCRVWKVPFWESSGNAIAC
ncbi:hypothetical protein DFH08DRAFT_821542 [Mycena albidolilacea]|uniref:Uncharacterized protein n=1 Tax=Mycena albidolilacea TaxID=1033008 RepID=A0AAD6ZAG4_9AGAR|nr:hypothetical protein DFH08DRAFT_821542 [Mycena albidolilacea]